MSKSSRPLPTWLKWLCRIFGVVLIGYSAWTIYIVGLALWLLAHSKEGMLARSGLLLAEGLGRLVGALLLIWLAVWLFRRSAKKVGEETASTVAPMEPVKAAAISHASPSRNATSERWQICNVLQATGADTSRVWQFNKSFSLNREQASRPGEALSPNLIGKSWSSIWQKKLNVAWLPPEHVFIRAAQFPPSTPAETQTMVELQLEKLSPIPVTQAVWSMHILPQSASGLQTVVVIIAERDVVEKFLGNLEGQGFMADRLELPMLDQLQATVSTGDGAWIYPEAAGGGKNSALVAWRYGGVLQSVGWITLAAGENRVTSLKDQLIHMAWAGELEGWLTSPPEWHLVADPSIAGEWESPLRDGLGTAVNIVAPITGTELAARTAKRTVESDGNVNLLPPEFAKRYQQQFVDRLWMRGLGAVLGVYLIGCLIYFVAVQVLSFRTTSVEDKVANLGVTYTNSLQLKARYGVLLDRQALKFAALDCWEAVAEKLPSGVTLDSMNFNDGKKLLLNGTAPSSQVNDVIDFSGNLRKATKDGQQLFNLAGGDALSTQVNPGNGTVRWSFGLELKRGETD